MDASERTLCLSQGAFCALWDPSHFPMVVDAETWQAELGTEAGMLGHVVGGFLVPLRTNCPGVYDVEVRVNWSGHRVELQERERSKVAASSGTFLFRSSGRVCFGGIEFLECVPGSEAGTLDIQPGDYECRIHLLDWQAEPGALDSDGLKSSEALPDFVVLLNAAPPGFCGEVTLQTFR